MTPKPPTWQVGDAVYGLVVDPITGHYRVLGIGRVVRIEGGTLHLTSTKGPRTWGVTAWPAFKTRADGEAYVAEHPTPQGERGQMAHYGPSSAPAERWECLRCEQIRAGCEPTVPDHSPRCSYRGAGRDPDPKG